MPIGSRKATRASTIGKSPQARPQGAGTGGGGPDNYDGTKNTNAGMPKDQPKQFDQPARVIKTYGS